MKSFESDIKKIAEKTRLKAVEREAIRERILAYMEYHPLKKEHFNVATLSPIQSSDFVYVSWNSLWVRVTSGVLALVLVIGVPLLAERSVPGDILYLVKTGVNEGIQTQFATSPYEKVELETKLIERRIAEARLLASEGKLTTEVEAQIARTVKGHATAVQSGLAELRESDADGAAIAEIVFSSALEVQSAVLGTRDSATSSSVESLLSVVNTVRDDVASDANPSTPSYDGLIARIELETTRAYEFSQSVIDGATPEETADIERRLADIDRSIVHAKELYEHDETGAVTELMNVLGLIQKLISFMTDIDVRESVALETLVPVVLTPEERIAIIDARIADVGTKLAEIDVRLASVTDTDLLEKLIPGRAYIDTLVASTSEAVSAGALDIAEIMSTEALIGVEDILNLTAPVEVPLEESVSEEVVDSVASSTPEVLEGVNGTTSEATEAPVATDTESVVE